MSKEQNETVSAVELEELSSSDSVSQKDIVSGNRLDLIQNVKVKINAFLGDGEISVKELFDLKEDSVVKLNQGSDTPIKLFMDDKLIAMGNLVVVGDNFGVQITDVIKE